MLSTFNTYLISFKVSVKNKGDLLPYAVTTSSPTLVETVSHSTANSRFIYSQHNSLTLL